MTMERRIEKLEQAAGLPNDVRYWTDGQIEAYLTRQCGHVPTDEELKELITRESEKC